MNVASWLRLIAQKNALLIDCALVVAAVNRHRNPLARSSSWIG